MKIKCNCVSIVLRSMLLVALGLGCQDNNSVLKESEKHLDAGTPQAAVDGLEAFIETTPEEPKARLLLGKAYNELGRYNDAVEQLRKASQLYAAQPEERIAARLELARTYLRFGDRTSAFVYSSSFNVVLRTPKHCTKSLNLWEIAIRQSNSRMAIRITIHRPSHRLAHRSRSHLSELTTVKSI